jgi:hypothetical protein
MAQMKEPPDHLMKEIEAALQMDVLDADEDTQSSGSQKRMADIFNKLDPALFETVSYQLSLRAYRKSSARSGNGCSPLVIWRGSAGRTSHASCAV